MLPTMDMAAAITRAFRRLHVDPGHKRPYERTIEQSVKRAQTEVMAHYAEFIGHRVEVHYRSGEIVLPATGTLVADSGKSIFLEEQIRNESEPRNFRWEISYAHIIRLKQSAMSLQPPPLPDAAQKQCL
jgi:hypothetical protein